MRTILYNIIIGMVKGILLFYLFALLPLSVQAGNPANYNVVPLPQSIVEQKGEAFVLEEGVQILAPAELQSEAEFLRQYLKEVTWNDLPIVEKRMKRGMPLQLNDQVAHMLPTPTANDAKNNASPSRFNRHSLSLDAVAGGSLNPEWIEWLMGFPVSWTEVD